MLAVARDSTFMYSPVLAYFYVFYSYFIPLGGQRNQLCLYICTYVNYILYVSVKKVIIKGPMCLMGRTPAWSIESLGLLETFIYKQRQYIARYITTVQLRANT